MVLVLVVRAVDCDSSGEKKTVGRQWGLRDCWDVWNDLHVAEHSIEHQRDADEQEAEYRVVERLHAALRCKREYDHTADQHQRGQIIDNAVPIITITITIAIAITITISSSRGGRRAAGGGSSSSRWRSTSLVMMSDGGRVPASVDEYTTDHHGD